jgi:hypothetical protein
MTDEDKKRIVSEPPPPTDEIDGEWEDDETLVRDAPSLSDPPKVSVRPSGTPSASTSTPPVKAAPAATSSSVPPTTAAATTPVPSVPPAEAAEDEDEDEDDTETSDDAADEDELDEDEDEDEDEDDHEDASAHPAPAAASKSDWIPEWGPFAVLGLLVCVSIAVGLGLVGGRSDISEEGEGKAEPAPAAKPVVQKPSAHP